MSFTITAPVKDPQATLRHGISWADWLGEGETIASQAVTAQAGIVVDQVAQADGIVSYRISGGSAGVDYIVTCRITTSLGNIDERSVLYRVRER